MIVTGVVGLYPLGGVAWDYVQYVAGLARLGFDVFYLEDTRLNPYDPRTRALTWKSCTTWKKALVKR